MPALSAITLPPLEEAKLVISKGTKATLKNFETGIHFKNICNQEIAELKVIVTIDRYRLAQAMHKAAQRSLLESKKQYRSSISRSYYSMYHAARSVIFLDFGGDDNEAHTKLPSHLPTSFPDRLEWENEIKLARFERNRADYDPYPCDDQLFKDRAQYMLNESDIFLGKSGLYLCALGCPLRSLVKFGLKKISLHAFTETISK